MRTTLKLAAMLSLVVLTASAPVAAPLASSAAVGPAFQSMSRLAFGPDGVLYVADTSAASIVAVDLGTQPGAAGTKDIPGIDAKIAALLGTDAKEIVVTDLAVHPKTRHSYISVMRGTGADAKPALVRVDGAGALSLVATEALKFTMVSLPNPVPNPTTGRSNRPQAITDMAFLDGRLYVAGLSNEEFSSKFWSVPYPFASADNGTSVEIYHGSHGRLETSSPVYSFVPTRVNGQPTLIAGYLCTPLVRFPVGDLKPGAKVMGTTIAELGNGNRPIDMILYKKDGKEFLLMSNTSRGVMKISTDGFGSATGITTQIKDKAGVGYETVASMTGIEQLDLLDATHSIVLARTPAGLNLQAVVLP